MKQKIYIAVLLAGMLALAGCGGGSSGISEEEAAERAAAAVAEAEAKAAEEAAAAAKAAEEEAAAAEEAAAKIVTDASADIDAATTLVAVDEVVDGLDRDVISQTDYETLQDQATTKKGTISATAVQAAIGLINAAANDVDVEFIRRTAVNNPNILPAAHAELEMAAEAAKVELKRRADQKRDDDSDTAVANAIDAINDAETLQEVTDAVTAANNNAAIKQEEKDKDADDAGSYQMAAAAKRAELNNPVQLAALKAAGEELTTKLGAATDAKDAVTQEQIEAVEAALGTLKTRITEATDVANTDKASYEGQRAAADGDTGQIATLKSRLAQVNALKTANTKLTNARQAAGDTPTRAQLNTVLDAHGELKTALDNAAQVLDKSTYQTAFDTASGWAEVQDTRITGLETQQNNQENADALAMTLKLWDAIGEDGNKGTVVDTATPDGANANDGLITIDRPDPDGAGDPGPIELEASKTVVAPLHGWVGSEQTLTVPDGTTNDDGTYTARLYSNVGKATEGGKFNAAGDAPTIPAEQGTFDSDRKVLTLVNSGALANEIASPTFDRDVPTSGPRFYKLPDPNDSGATRITAITGSYYGVSGRYTCTPADGNGCSVTKASEGYTLGGGVWTFTPNDPEDRVTETADNAYNVYGWWLHEDDEGKATVSAFTAVRNNEDNNDPDVAVATGLNAFTGTATYKGGAAGKYAIRAGSTNDAGHFIADATLNANFTEEEISGTISNFKVGDDGESRDWSIALEESDIGDTGLIRDAGANNTVESDDSGAMTTWKMNDTDTNATKSGDWTGQLRNNIVVGEDGAGTPQSATGIFHSEYNNTGRMVGAFGVNLDNN